jgi:very-short-patch-repair endonuclease
MKKRGSAAADHPRRSSKRTDQKPAPKRGTTRAQKLRRLTSEQRAFWRESIEAGVSADLILHTQKEIDDYIHDWKSAVSTIIEKRAQSRPGRTKRERMRSLSRALAAERRDFERWAKGEDE